MPPVTQVGPADCGCRESGLRLVRRHWACPRPAPGRPRTAPAVRAGARDGAGQPGLGLPVHPRRADRLGYMVVPSTVWQILKDGGIEPRAHAVRADLAGPC